MEVFIKNVTSGKVISKEKKISDGLIFKFNVDFGKGINVRFVLDLWKSLWYVFVMKDVQKYKK